MAHDLHGGLVPITWVVVEIEGKLFSAFDFPCAEGHGLADVTHNGILIIVDNHGGAFLHGCKGTQ